jgi:aldose 1-epimerase
VDLGYEAPSGRQHDLAHGNQRATVVEVGGALRAYSVGGHDVVAGYGADQRCTGARGQPLVPWPNRVRDGRYTFAGEELQLALTEPAKGNAIHGVVRWDNWRTGEHRDDYVVLEHVLHPRPGYPFSLALRMEYALGDQGLHVRLSAANVGASPLPFGAGAHPYVTLGTLTIDALVLRAPGRRWFATDERQIPVSAEPVEGTPYDFRAARPIGDTVLDTAYGDMDRDGDGRAAVHLSTADDASELTLWMGESVGYLMLFTGDTLERKDERRRSLGIEPMTCPPNAFVSGEAVRILEPGETSTFEWGISPSGIEA